MLSEFDESWPLNEAQRGIWFSQENDPDNPMLNQGECFELRGRLDVDALERAVGIVVTEAASLRLRFLVTESGPRQRVDPDLSHPMHVVDLSRETDPDAAVRSAVREDLATRVDMVRGPLYVHKLFRLGEDHHVWYHRTHHLIVDAFSHALLAQRVAAVYSGLVEGSGIGEPLGSLGDLVEETRDYESGAGFEAGTRFWSDYLEGAPRHTTLARRSGAAGDHFLRVTRFIGEERMAQLERVARNAKTGWQHLLIAVAAAHTQRWAGEDRVLLGLPVTGRTTRLARGVPSMHSNILPLWAEVDPARTVGTLARDLAVAMRSCLRHQRYPLIATRRMLGYTPQDTRQFGPLINIMAFDYDIRFGDLSCEVRGYEQGFVEELHINVFRRSVRGPVPVAFVGNPAVFTEEELERQADAFVHLVDALCEDPDRPLARLRPLPEAERLASPREGGDDTADAEPTRAVHRVYEAQAALTPDAVALVFEDERVSYGDLNARANRLARHLRARGAGPGDSVGVLLERGVDLAVTLLAVLKSGAGYVPLDPEFPEDRLSGMVRDSGARLVVTTSRLARLRVRAGARVVLDAEADQVGARPDGDLSVPVSRDDLACVMFTSGSTGGPKGVLTPHRALVETFLSQDYAAFGPDQVWLQCSPMSWDAFALEFWGALLHGAVCVLQPGQRPRFDEIADLVARHRVTALQMSAGLFNVMLDERPEVFDVVRQAMTAGEAASVDHVSRALAAHPGVRVLNGYGPVENMGFTTTHDVDGVDEGQTSIPIGRPIRGARVYVVDGFLRLVPVGAVGEVYVAGGGVAWGYVGRSGVTAERFVPDPFSAVVGARMYRTGDRARWSSEGVLEFLGRVDDQVKIRGFRVEPGEVEAVLSEQPGVGRCVVVVREDVAGDRRLVGYVVGGEGVVVDGLVVRAGVAARLPEYMVPSVVMVVGELPLNANGKVDRGALPVPDYGAVGSGRGPRGPQEEILCGLFAQVLGVERVGVDDSFFDLGGHSLLAISLISRVRTAFGSELTMRELFRSPTVEGIARAIDTARGDGPRPALTRRERPDQVPLSFAQRRLWFLDQWEESGTAYNVPLVLRMTGEVDVTALEAALGDVVERHEALRTVFPSEGGEPYQRVLPVERARPVLWLRECGADGVAAEVDRLVRSSFDLETRIPLRAWLLRLTEHEHVLVLLLHHIASDGWSMQPLLADLASAYTDRLGGGVPLWRDRPDLGAQYADYTLWQRDLLGEESDPDSLLSEQLAFWRRALDGAPEVLELPADRPRPPSATHRGSTVEFRLPDDVRQDLSALASEHGVTLFMVLQAAVAATLSTVGAGDDIPIGTAVAGRSDQALDDVVGFFVNTLVTRTDLSGDPTLAELLGRVRESVLAAFDHQDLPFERVVEALAPSRSTAHHPLFQVMLILQNNARASASLPGVVCAEEPFGWENAKFDLNLMFSEDEAGVEGVLEFATDLFDRTTAVSLVERLQRVLAVMARDPATPLSGVDVLSEAERIRLLEEFNAAGPDTDADLTVHGLFEEQAARFPERTAVVCAGQEWSYARLDGLARRVAHLLSERGVGPGQAVALLMGRSTLLLASMLGVLKTGAAFLPLDPAHTTARLLDVLTESGSALLLTDEATWSGDLDGPGRGFSVLRVREEDLPRDRARSGGAGRTVRGAQLAYVTYTSGSTGRPKGVATAHANAVSYLRSMEASGLSGTGPAIAAWTASPAFDLSVQQWGVLCEGGTVVVADDRERVDPEAFSALVLDHRVTHIGMTPSQWRAVREGLETRPADVAPLHLSLGGESLFPEEWDELAEWAPAHAVRVHHLYGPTETTVWTTGTALSARRRPTIGSPLPGARVYVVDGFLRLVPVGAVGEVYVAGGGVAWGYVGRSGVTAERFVPDPFSAVVGARMYRTGDRARWSSEGVLEFLGRVDDQVKIRGFRVEPGEVEAVLSEQPGVGRCVVVVREDVAGDRRLVGYVVGGEGVVVDGLVVRAGVAARLPEYMVPSVVMVVGELPLNANGKVDRGALPVPDYGAVGSGRGPRGPQEEILCGLFAQVLGVERVGVDDSFFDLGGHSLLATRLVARIRSAVPVNITLEDVFRAPTPAQLGEHLKQAPGAPARPTLRRRTREGVEIEG